MHGLPGHPPNRLQPFPATLNMAAGSQRAGLPPGLDLEPGGNLADVMKKRQGAEAFDFLGRKIPSGGTPRTLPKRWLLQKGDESGSDVRAMVSKVVPRASFQICLAPGEHNGHAKPILETAPPAARSRQQALALAEEATQFCKWTGTQSKPSDASELESSIAVRLPETCSR